MTNFEESQRMRLRQSQESGAKTDRKREGEKETSRPVQNLHQRSNRTSRKRAQKKEREGHYQIHNSENVPELKELSFRIMSA